MSKVKKAENGKIDAQRREKRVRKKFGKFNKISDFRKEFKEASESEEEEVVSPISVKISSKNKKSNTGRAAKEKESLVAEGAKSASKTLEIFQTLMKQEAITDPKVKKNIEQQEDIDDFTQK